MLLLAFPIYSQGASLATLTGTVYVDLNLDGVFQTGDLGVRNDLIQIFDQNNNLVDQAFTDSQGRYSFTDLASGIYTVVNTIPSSLGNTADLSIAQILDTTGNPVLDPNTNLPVVDNAVPNSSLVQISNIDLQNPAVIAQGFNFGNDQYPMQLYSKYLLVDNPSHRVQPAIVTTVPEPALLVSILAAVVMACVWGSCRRRKPIPEKLFIRKFVA
jgi:hypothetical protein